MFKSVRPSRRGLLMVVNRHAAGTPGRQVLAVGKITPVRCSNCGDFPSVRVRDGARLVTVHCPVCSPIGGAAR